MLCGIDQIDLEDWKTNTDYIGGYCSNSPQILYFWDMILNMSNEQRAQLLQFATGTTLLPPGGFMNLMGSMGPRKFTIYRSTKGTQYLPNIHTCFNQIDQPDAEFEEDFEESQYGSSADFDYRKPKYQLIKEKNDEIIIPTIIAIAAGIPGTQEIISIPPLWSAKVDPYREKYIQIELLDNEKKVIPEYIQQPDSSLLPIKTKKESIILSVPGNIATTEYPASFINITPSTHHSLFVISTSFRPPAPALFVLNLCHYNGTTLTGLGLQRYIEEVPGVVLNIDRQIRELILADGSLVLCEMLIIAAGLQEQTLQRLSHPNAQNDFYLDVVDGAIIMNVQDDAIRFQMFFHKPTQPSGKILLEDEDEIGVIYGATLRAYSVFHGLLQDGDPGKRLLFRKPAENKSKLYCKNPNEDNIRAGTTCPVTEECISGILEPTDRGCFCTANYQPDSCTCTSAFHPDNEQGCVCDENEDAVFEINLCRATKTCTGSNTPIGCTPPVCTAYLLLNPSCQCSDSDENQRYSKSQCQANITQVNIKDCNQSHIAPVSPDTGKCNKDYSPVGCNCYMKAGVSYELDFALSCLRNVPLKSNEQSTTISLLKEYLNSYAFLDTSLNPPGSPIGYGKHAVNINFNLDKINNITYTNIFDFYEDIMILINNLKDPHTILTPPCVSKVYYMFPQITVNQSKTDYSLSFIININEQNYSLDKINILGQIFYDNNTYVDVEVTYPTLEVIAICADEEVSISRNPITRMNYALMNDYAKRLLIDLCGNGGGQVQLGRQLLNFLFPNVDHPLYQTVDETKSIINEALANITKYQFEYFLDEAQLSLELDYMGIHKLFYSRRNRKRTTQSVDKKSIKTVNLTYKTDLSWSNKGGYGFSDETSDQLLEYKIVDADFRVEYFPFDSLISDEDEQRYALYDEVLKREKELLGNDTKSSSSYISASNNDSTSKLKQNAETLSSNKCLSWEVETNNTYSPNNCKGCLTNDPYSIYGHPCSVRGSSEAKGRYSNGTAKIGEYLTDKCIFSHCKVGYYRMNFLIGQKIDQKCSLVPLGPN
ncbi:MAG: hypothetical protein EZS28_004714 [Streblomastix strix]|uniref:HECT-type E3 ubiquitin transferase n=1 Tax=Streblomastix strix TaxID=222440 RepID=A0A5J4WZJ2_9EUKA|nr:MAG: hypothetical protein EZS28_004714 [Streblomastix strix]